MVKWVNFFLEVWSRESSRHLFSYSSSMLGWWESSEWLLVYLWVSWVWKTWYFPGFLSLEWTWWQAELLNIWWMILFLCFVLLSVWNNMFLSFYINKDVYMDSWWILYDNILLIIQLDRLLNTIWRYFLDSMIPVSG